MDIKLYKKFRLLHIPYKYRHYIYIITKTNILILCPLSLNFKVIISIYFIAKVSEMSSKNSASLALFLSLNLVFFALISAYSPSDKTRACPINSLKLGVCADVLGLVNVKIGSPPTLPCCSLIQGLVDLEAAVCLCTAIKANVLGIDLDIPLSLSLVLNNCGRKLPSGFECANN